MKSDRDDIEKYKRGELTPAQMHALEKRALHDPFLAEALEGIQSISEQEFASDLTELEGRLKGKTKRRNWFMPLRIAAGILILAGSGYLVYTTMPDSHTPLSEASPSGEEKVSPSTDSIKNSLVEESTSQPLALLKPADEQTPREETPKMPVEAQGPYPGQALGEQEQGLAGISEADMDLKAGNDSLSSLAEKKEDMNIAKKEAVEAPPVVQENKDAAGGEGLDIRVLAKKMESMPRAGYAGKEWIITGKVVSAEDGTPIPGVAVYQKGTLQETKTDMYGNYSISLFGTNPQVVYSFSGLQTQEVTVNQAQTFDVQMVEDAAQLSEVVAAGRAMDSKRDDIADKVQIMPAYPDEELKTYNQYLEENLHYPKQALENGIKGKVVIQFTVGANGSLSAFRVLKGIGYGCDDEVIRLVKEGPDWSPATQNNVAIESEVKVKVKFDPARIKK